MKIAIFTNNYLPNPYGVSSSIESFRQEFEKLGHQVFVFAPAWKKHADTEKNIFRYPSIDIEIKFRFPLPIPYSRKMDKILENLDLDIIHSQHPNLLGNAAMKWARKKNIPLVFTWHTLYDQYTNFFPFFPKKMAANWIIRSAVKYANLCNQVVVPAPSVKGIIQKWGVTNSHIEAVSSGVEKDFENPDTEVIREKYGIEKDEVLLFTVTRLTAEKNVEFLFDSVSEILKEDFRVKWLVVGDGYLLKKLKKLAVKKNIDRQAIFTGVISKKEIKNYFAAGDIFVYASKSETQGMILTEAMYMGLPIVAVRATGAIDHIENGKTGILVSEDSPSEISATADSGKAAISRGKEEFKQAVARLIKNEDLRRQIGEAAKKVAQEKYTAEICAKKMLEVYEEAIKNFKPKVL